MAIDWGGFLEGLARGFIKTGFGVKTNIGEYSGGTVPGQDPTAVLGGNRLEEILGQTLENKDSNVEEEQSIAKAIAEVLEPKDAGMGIYDIVKMVLNSMSVGG